MSGGEYYFQSLKTLLGDRFGDFCAAYNDKPRHKALRVNTTKISVSDFVSLCADYESRGVREYALKPNPLCGESFYTAVKPSLDPLYHAGLYYMQEPSASRAVAAFSPYIGERVVDLCAAPGGKATQAAAFMKGGFMLANEIDDGRKWALIENLDRLGINNAIVTSASPDRLADKMHGFFDTVICDAPCSGGGMMRYESVPYSAEIVAGCAERQKRILDAASRLLRRGGYLLYSTCTFSVEENEQNVAYLLDKGFETVPVPLGQGEERGAGIPDARRIYPHNFDGEGHFYCILKKTDGETLDLDYDKSSDISVRIGNADIACVRTRLELLPISYVFPQVPVFRWGTPVREPVQKRVRDRKHGGYALVSEFSHALSHGLSKAEVQAVGAVELGDEANRYIRGEQLEAQLPHGDHIATVNGYALGWVKCAPDGTGRSVLKNRYPKNLRV